MKKYSKTHNNPEAARNHISKIKELGGIVKITNQSSDILLEYSFPNERKLSISQQKIVRSIPYKKWFGDWENNPKIASKVVDDKGLPLIVYHGTNVNLNTFKGSKSIGTHNEDDQLEGIYFTDSKDAANWYALIEDDDRFLKKVFLNLRNPFFAKTIKELKTKLNVTKLAGIQSILVKKGYDGLIVKEGFYTLGLHTLYLAFYPNQIKSAVGNTTFNSKSDDIRL